MSAIQNVFQDHGSAYLSVFGDRMPDAHRKVIQAICNCRTGDCGNHLFSCPDCGECYVAASSCGNRHCPVCQHDKSSRWIYRQQLKLLACSYFLVTFTVPKGLRAVARSNQRAVYSAMFASASDSLRTLEADPRFVGCHVSGFFGVLHTWGRQLQYHPHIHFVVPGGGLSANRQQWVPAHGQFLVHVRALSKLYRGKMKAAMEQAGLLSVIPDEVWCKDWVVHCKAVGDGRHIMKYLGAYVFRVCISDARIVYYDGEKVTFKYQRVNSSKWRKMTLTAFEFIRRYLQHVLPKGFMKVRHYGFLSPNFSTALQKIREMICILYELLRKSVPAEPPPSPRPLRCPKCCSRMQWIRFFPPSACAAPP